MENFHEIQSNLPPHKDIRYLYNRSYSQIPNDGSSMHHSSQEAPNPVFKVDPYEKLNQDLLAMRVNNNKDVHPKINSLMTQVDKDFASSRARASQVQEYIKR